MQKAEDYTVFIKNSMAFPYFGEEYARNNLIGNNRRPCMFKVRTQKILKRLINIKSVNLQYNTLGRLDDGTNESSTKRLMFQALFFFNF